MGGPGEGRELKTVRDVQVASYIEEMHGQALRPLHSVNGPIHQKRHDSITFANVYDCVYLGYPSRFIPPLHEARLCLQQNVMRQTTLA